MYSCKLNVVVPAGRLVSLRVNLLLSCKYCAVLVAGTILVESLPIRMLQLVLALS